MTITLKEFRHRQFRKGIGEPVRADTEFYIPLKPICYLFSASVDWHSGLGVRTGHRTKQNFEANSQSKFRHNITLVKLGLL